MGISSYEALSFEINGDEIGEIATKVQEHWYIVHWNYR